MAQAYLTEILKFSNSMCSEDFRLGSNLTNLGR